MLTVPWLNTEVTWVVDSDIDPRDLWTSFGGGWRFILVLLVPDEDGLAGGGNVSMMMARNVWVMMARLVMMELLMMNWREDMSTWMVTLLLTSLALDPRVQLVVTGIRISVKELSIILLTEKPFKEQSQGKLTFPAVQMVGGKRTGY